jgi:hypothetical protein
VIIHSHCGDGQLTQTSCSGCAGVRAGRRLAGWLMSTSCTVLACLSRPPHAVAIPRKGGSISIVGTLKGPARIRNRLPYNAIEFGFRGRMAKSAVRSPRCAFLEAGSIPTMRNCRTAGYPTLGPGSTQRSRARHQRRQPSLYRGRASLTAVRAGGVRSRFPSRWRRSERRSRRGRRAHQPEALAAFRARLVASADTRRSRSTVNGECSVSG